MLAPRRKYTRKPRVARRRRVYRPRMIKGRSYHAPKRFTSTFKLLDVIASPYGTHPDDYTRNTLSVSLQDMPIFTNLHSLFGQFAITGVKLTYRPTITSYNSTIAGTIASPQLLFAEDKNQLVPLSPLQMRSQDNCRTFSASRGWSKYIRNPRPLLYQQDLGQQQLKVIQRSREINWLTPEQVNGPEANLRHLMAQLCVQDVTGATGEVGVGELWAKVYVVCKEQSKHGAI